MSDIEQFVYLGTESNCVIACTQYTDGRIERKQVARLPNPLGIKHGAPGGVAVEWVTAHPSGAWLYAAISYWDFAPGMIYTFAIDPDSGTLSQPDNGTPSGGYQIAQMALHGTRWLAAAHYLSGHVSLFDVSSGPPAGMQPLCVVELPDLREKPPPPSAPLKASHVGLPLAHGLTFTPMGGWLVVVDTGQARLVSLRVAPECGGGALEVAHSLAVTDPTEEAPSAGCVQRQLRSRLGCRPRHAAFSSDGATLVVLLEAANVLSVHGFDTAAAPGCRGLEHARS